MPAPAAQSHAGASTTTSSAAWQEQEHGWRRWIAPMEDPLGARPAQWQQPWGKDLLTPPRLPQAALRSAQGVPSLPAAQLDCLAASQALGAFAPGDTLQRRDRLAQGAEALAAQPLPEGALRIAATDAQAQSAESTDQAMVLPLAQALRLALCLNPQVRASWMNIARASAQLGLARSSQWPQASASLSRQYSRSRMDGGQSSAKMWASTQSLTLSWRVFDFGARSAHSRAAQAQLRAALAAQQGAIRSIAANVLETYVQAQATQAQWRRQQHIAQTGQAIAAAVQRRHAQGAESNHGLLQAQASSARHELEGEKIQAELAMLAQRLRSLTGLAPLQPIVLEDIPEELAAWPSQQAMAGPDAPQPATIAQTLQRSLPQWLLQAREASPAVLEAAAALQAAAASAQAVQSEAMPRLDATYGHYRNGRPAQPLLGRSSREHSAGLTLTIPLWEGFASTYRIRSATATRESARMALDAARLEAERELLEAYTQAQTSLLRLGAASRLYTISQRVVQSNEALYQHGVLDAVALHRALLDWQEASNELTQSHAQWLRAKLRLWLLSG
ncbi:TolC family protein [Vandammella animalimorsus]|uniref:TolC family protein n=1 Tax=Vandammella animalimorsus TaxID=2029117 RepID=UPI00325C2CC1